MKRLVAHNASDFFGGGEIWLCRFLASLQSRGHSVLLLCRNHRIAGRALEYGIPTEPLHLGGALALHDAARLARRLRRARADVLLLTTFKKIWLGGLAARLAGTPKVFARVGISTISPHSLLYRMALRRWVDAVIVNAEEIRDVFLATMPELAPGRVITIYNGVRAPLTEQPEGALRERLGIPADALVVGTLARLAHEKRLHRLLRAHARLSGNVHCILAGEGRERAGLEQLAAHLGTDERVHFLGFQADVRAILDALDVFVLTSDWEGMSTAMLQALAAGVPVVSTRVSGTSVALEPNGAGPAPGVVVGFEVEEIAAAIEKLLADAALRARMGAAGVERARERFGFDRMIDEYERALGLG